MFKNKLAQMLLAVTLLLAAMNINAQDLKMLAATHAPRLEKVLTANIQDFWLKNGLDQQNGGYLISFDNQGKLVEPYTKMIVTQARQVWLHSRLARAGYKREQNLQAAAHGFRFLTEKMWDAQHGGFYWEVDATGKPLKTHKHLYGQSFGLYALAEYYLAAQRKEALDWAKKLFALLEAKAHDAQYKGYHEMFNADWTPVPPGTANYISPAPAPVKLYNTHLHLLEALTTFYRASKLPLARARLLELIEIETAKVVRQDLSVCTDVHAPDWTPRLDGAFATVSYGHDLENIWLVLDACAAAKVAPQRYQKLFAEMFAYSMKYGFDHVQGGFFYSGPFKQAATNRRKEWWTEAEALVAALWMHRLTGQAQYLDVFAKTWEFVEKHMIDWEHGEWYATVTPEGRVTGAKASIWKAGYHNGRAMIECLEVFKRAGGGKR
jgi:mannobiose 2-epimerase